MNQAFQQVATVVLNYQRLLLRLEKLMFLLPLFVQSIDFIFHKGTNGIVEGKTIQLFALN